MIFIIIPAYNEKNKIKDVVNDAKKYGKVIVVDDGSTDGTANVVEKMGVDVVKLQINCGKGFALRMGYSALMSYNPQPEDIIVTMDADGQHDAKYIPDIVKKLRNEGLDMVIGARDKSNYPLFKRFGNWGLSKITSILSGMKISDTETGYRAIKWESLKKIMPLLKSKSYSIEAEHIIIAGKLKLKIGEYKIKSRYIKNKGVGVVDGIKNGIFAIRTWIRLKRGVL